MKVPYVNLGLQNELILEDLMKNIKKLITSGQFILGEEVHNFERSFADRVGTRYASWCEQRYGCDIFNP